MNNNRPEASVILIGNEILSGRTQDLNLNYIAKNLCAMGIDLPEARIIPDVEDVIISTVNELRAKYDYVFTSGGIGPTHDDITSLSIAKAFCVDLKEDKNARKGLEEICRERNTELNDAQLKMAMIPDGAELIYNPVSAAPGYRMENVFVMAGIPIIMQAMFDSMKNSLKTGKPVLSNTINTQLPESIIAADLSAIQNEYSDVDIGSYPHFGSDKSIGVSIVIRVDDEKILKEVSEKVQNML